MPTVADLLAQALAYHRAGQPHEAERLLRQILQIEPANFDALYGLGASLHTQGKPHEAVAYLQKAVERRPEALATRLDLGIALAEADRFDESVAQFQEAKRRSPGSTEIDGMLRQTLGMRQNALAIQFVNQGNLKLAEKCCREAVELTPNSAAAHRNLGNVLKGQGSFDEAVACYRRVLAIDGRDAGAHDKLGQIALDRKQFGEAADWFRRTLQLNPDLLNVHNQLGAALIEQGHLEEAESTFRRLIELRPDHFEACNNLGTAIARARRLDEAAEWFRRALQIKPDYAEAHFNLGNALKAENKLADSESHFRRVLEIDPNHTSAQLALAFALLGMGKLAEGWSHYECRFRTPQLKEVARREPRWTGEDLAGRTILLGHEQGFGDTLQFVRYAVLLHERGARVVVECSPPVAQLLATCDAIDQVAVAGDPIPVYDYAIQLPSLPGMFGTTVETIPAPIPYLRPDPVLVDRWRETLGHANERRIVIAWHGQPKHTSDRFRSIPLAQFEPLARIAGIRLFSIQIGHGREQLNEYAGDWPLVDLADQIHDFRDTAALLHACDLLITCDSAPAHLAGALGLPVWVAVAYSPDWRWMLDREDSPWYPTLRLFRQTRLDDWTDVFARMAAELRKPPAG